MPSYPSLNDNFFRERPVANYSNRESIRNQLEYEAWKNHPGFAAEQAGKRHPNSPRKSLKWQDRALLVLSALLLLLLIFRIETASAQQNRWGLEFLGDDGSQPSLALNTEIQVDITGLVARINVSQAFRNNSHEWSEAIYRFPLPDGSAVDRMTIRVGAHELVGEIQEKHEARRQYQQARSSGKIATLVEQQRANQFETRLANIGPDQEITVSISFLARVDYRDGSFSLRIPMTFTPRWNRGTAAITSGFFNETSPDPTLTTDGLEGRPWEQRSTLLPGAGTENLATLWARSKIEALEDGRIFGHNPGHIREAVTDLALEFGLLTPYTSLVAVDRAPSRPAGDALNGEEIPNLLPAGSSAASAGFSQTATGWVAQLILSFITLLVAAGMLLISPRSRKGVLGDASSPMATSVTP